MIMNPQLSRKFPLYKLIFEDIVERQNYHTAAIVHNGRILEDTFVGDPDTKLDDVLNHLESALASIVHDDNDVEDILIAYPPRKVYFRNLSTPDTPDSCWLMVTMDANTLYFKRFLTRIIKQLQIL